jgi:hypothetical protein
LVVTYLGLTRPIDAPVKKSLQAGWLRRCDAESGGIVPELDTG